MYMIFYNVINIHVTFKNDKIMCKKLTCGITKA